ncbi:MAG: hypothetical protein AAF982_05630 [Pseudomonadota bacterium]
MARTDRAAQRWMDFETCPAREGGSNDQRRLGKLIRGERTLPGQESHRVNDGFVQLQ